MATDLTAPLQDIALAFRHARGLRRLGVQAVRKARNKGFTWEDIGRAMGYSKQGAQQWYERNKDAGDG